MSTPPQPGPAAPRPQDDGAPRPQDGGATHGLDKAVREIERHVATGGWDGPVRVFALVRTAAALVAERGLAAQLPAETVEQARRDAHHLTAIEQEGLPAAGDLEELLGGLSWPSTVDGSAVVVERVVLPPEAEAAMPADPDEALAYLMAHPARQDVRLAVGVLRGGPSWCVIRTRADDQDSAVAGAPDLVPGLVQAVRATLD